VYWHEFGFKTGGVENVIACFIYLVLVGHETCVQDTILSSAGDARVGAV
jgi:hypothetical protein